MSYRFAVLWLKAFRDSPEKVCQLYADEFLFEDLMLGQSITNKGDLARAFAPYANTDPDNGIGLHQFRIDEVIGGESSALIRWTWQATGAAAFLGIPTNGKVVGTTGHTMHVYEGGKIKREFDLLGRDLDPARPWAAGVDPGRHGAACRRRRLLIRPLTLPRGGEMTYLPWPHR